jgi:hypothetical protein
MKIETLEEIKRHLNQLRQQEETIIDERSKANIELIDMVIEDSDVLEREIIAMCSESKTSGMIDGFKKGISKGSKQRDQRNEDWEEVRDQLDYEKNKGGVNSPKNAL